MSKTNQNTKYTKDEINSKINSKRLHLPKCYWCLLNEDIEVEIVDGGQPVYHFLASVE